MTASKSAGAADAEARFRKNPAAFQYHFVQFFTDHLARCSRLFEGDLQAMLILGLIGQVYIKSLGESGQPRPARGPAEATISASRIADVSGIPRETVRRKLAKLAERGWIARNEDGGWRITTAQGASVAGRAFAEFNDGAVTRVADLVSKLNALPD